MKTGFKATYDFMCKSHKFEIGQTYELPNQPIPCKYGFHYCQNPKDVLEYYSIKHNFRLLEIQDLGESITQEDKSVTNKIRIIREVPKEEYYSLFGIVNNELEIIDRFDNWSKHIFDERNNQIYVEYPNGYWQKCEYDENNNRTYYENSSGSWIKETFDEKNNEIYCEHSNGYWVKRTFDENNNETSYWIGRV